NSAKQQLQAIDVSTAAGVDATDITMKVIKAGGGDGLAALGRILFGTHNLGIVSLKGDLGQIDGGGGIAGTPAIKVLKADTLGFYGVSVNAGGNFDSEIDGGVGALKINGDVQRILLNVSGNIGPVKIGGSLL